MSAALQALGQGCQALGLAPRLALYTVCCVCLFVCV